MRISKNVYIIASLVFILAIIYLFYPTKIEDSLTVEAPIVNETEQLVKTAIEKLTDSYDAHIQFTNYLLKQLTDEQLQSFLNNLIYYEIKDNLAIIDKSGTFEWSITKNFHEIFHQLENPLVKDFYHAHFQFEDEIDLLTAHSLQMNKIEKENAISYVYSGKLEELRNVNNKIIFEMDETLAKSANLPSHIFTVDLTYQTIRTGNSSSTIDSISPELIEIYEKTNTNFYHLQIALYQLMDKFSLKSEVLSYLQETTAYHLYLIDGNGITSTIVDKMLVTQRPNLTIYLENYLFPTILDHWKNEFFESAYKMFTLTSNSTIPVIEEKQISEWTNLHTINYRFTIEDEPITIQLNDAFQTYFQVPSQLQFTLAEPKFNDGNYIINDYQALEKTLQLGQQLFYELLPSQPTDKQIEIVKPLVQHQFFINESQYNYMNSIIPLTTNNLSLHFLQRQSETIIKSPELQRLLRDDLINEIDLTILSEHSLPIFVQNDTLHQQIFATTKNNEVDSTLEFKITEPMKNKLNFLNSSVKIHLERFGSQIQMRSAIHVIPMEELIFNSSLSYLQKEVDLLSSSFQLLFKNVDSIDEYLPIVTTHSTWKELIFYNQEGNETIKDSNEFTTKDNFQLALMIENPLLIYFPQKWANNYLKEQFPIMDYIQVNDETAVILPYESISYNGAKVYVDILKSEKDSTLEVDLSKELINYFELPFSTIYVHKN